ncbi:hypothetical protein [Mycoplasma hafezii]|uniref:hypothetical protein n=1 Tax=Mycoplasma hafezii TaxID=525886 RepID=UPI003CEABCC7
MLNKNQLTKIEESVQNKKNHHLYLIAGKPNFNIENDLLEFTNLFLNEKVESFNAEILPSNLFLLGFDDDSSKSNLEITFARAMMKNEGDEFKVVVINQLEKFSIQALNACLKFIEEPSDNVVIIASTNNLNAIIPTIRSRAQIIHSQSENPIAIYSQFIANGIMEPFGLIASYLSNDIQQAKKYISDEYIAIFDKLCAAYIEMLKRDNKFYLYAFLTENLNKETPNENVFILNSMLLITKAHLLFHKHNWTNNKYLDRIITISKKLNGKVDAFTLIQIIDEFTNALKGNGNFLLQKEKFLIDLLELYEW